MRRVVYSYMPDPEIPAMVRMWWPHHLTARDAYLLIRETAR